MASEIAERYAQGLFELARENGTVEAKKDQTLAMLEVLESNPELHTFLRAVKVTKEEKRQFIENCFGPSFDHDMISFIKLIIDKGRLPYLKEMLQEYERLANNELGIEKAVVTSARALKEEDMTRIRETLVRRTGKKIILVNQVNPDLIAGIKVTVGNNVTDVTMKNKMDSMKEMLLKGGQA